jgi:hypothetical protein
VPNEKTRSSGPTAARCSPPVMGLAGDGGSASGRRGRGPARCVGLGRRGFRRLMPDEPTMEKRTEARPCGRYGAVHERVGGRSATGPRSLVTPVCGTGRSK